jgi:hypothetical protein
MDMEAHIDDSPEIDEGSWVYLSGVTSSASRIPGLHEHLIEACEASGWAIVSCSAEERVGQGADPAHFFESVSHAVEHADVVVALIGPKTEISDAELGLAYSHGRPIVGVDLSGDEGQDAGMQTMLQDYGRARVISCASAEECAVGLRETFSDPAFAETIRLAR